MYTVRRYNRHDGIRGGGDGQAVGGCAAVEEGGERRVQGGGDHLWVYKINNINNINNVDGRDGIGRF